MWRSPYLELILKMLFLTVTVEVFGSVRVAISVILVGCIEATSDDVSLAIKGTGLGVKEEARR